MPRPERPLESGDDVLLRFAADLRTLRKQAGNPTYRELAQRAHYSAGTLSDAAGGRKLPSLAVALAYVRSCGGNDSEWERRWHEIAAGIADEQSVDDISVDAPYVGLRPFQPADAGRFFGRENLVDNLVARLADRRFLAVFGASGAGKSSLLRAGLLPRLAGTFAETVMFKPGPRPLEECAVHFAGLLGVSVGQIRTELRADPTNLHRLVRQALASADDAELVLVVDQFEEIFTLCTDLAERTAFITALLTAANSDNSRARIVLGVRAHFYPHCADHPDLADALNDAQVLVRPMTVEELREAVTRPATQVGQTVESTLVATLVAEAHGHSGALPMLSHVLLETWRRRRGNTLSLAGYQATGGIQGAMARTAENCYDTFDDDQKNVAKRLFMRLTALGGDTKRRMSSTELDETDPNTATVVRVLADARLITLDEGTVEIAHESLIKAWPRLRDWISEDREGLRVHRLLTEAAATWESLGREPGALYRGTRLSAATEWSRVHDDALTPRERDFLHASAHEIRRERTAARRRSQQLRWLAVALSALLVVAVALTIATLGSQQLAVQERQIAVSRQLAAQARAIASSDPGKAIQLSLSAVKAYPTFEARSVLLSLTGRLAAHGTIPASGPVALSADGNTLAVAESDGISIWDLPHRAQIHKVADAVPNGAFAVSPDGSLLVVGSFNGPLQVWHLTGPTHVELIDRSGPAIQAVAIDHQGTRVAVLDDQQTVGIWDLRDHRLLGTSAGQMVHSGGTIAFSPDDRFVAATHGPDNVALLDTRTAAVHMTLPGGTLSAFSVDGSRIAVTDKSSAVGVWDTGTGQLVRRFDDLGVVNGLAFEQSGGDLIVASSGRGVTIWNIDRNSSVKLAEADTLWMASANGVIVADAVGRASTNVWDTKHLPFLAFAEPRNLTFDPTGRSLYATTGNDLPLQKWDLTAPTAPTRVIPSGTDGGEKSVFSADHSRVAIPTVDGTVVYDVHSGRLLANLPARKGRPGVAAFAADGHRIAIGYGPSVPDSPMGEVVVWDVDNQRAIIRSPNYSQVVAYSPDGQHVAYANAHEVLIWNVNTDNLTRLDAGPGTVTALSFGANRLYAGYTDGRVSVWDTGRSQHIQDLTGHAGPVTTIEPSPHGNLLATGGTDGTVNLWDTSTWEQTAALTASSSRITAAAWSPVGDLLAAGSADGTITTWHTDTGQAIDQICHVLATDFPDQPEGLHTCP